MAKKKKPKIVVKAETTEKDRLVRYVLDCKKEAEDASKDRRNKWEELWNLYQNKQDYSLKMSWQSKCVMPKLFTQVEKSSAEVKRAVLQSGKLFKLELDDDVLQPQINQLSDLLQQPQMVQNPEVYNAVRKQLLALQQLQDQQLNKKSADEKKFRKEITKSNFASMYSEMVKPAFLLGLGVPKVLWDADKKRATYENVDVQNLYISPDYEPTQRERPLYIIEYKEPKLAELRKMAKEANSAGGQIYDMDEIDKIEDDWVKEEKKTKARAQRGIKQFSPVGKRVGILEFWGDVINPEDDSIEENLLMVVANEKYLIRKQDNPFSHKLPPYILTIPLPYPHRGWTGISLVEAMVKPIYTYNNIVNMAVDNLNFVVNKMFEYNPSNLIGAQDVTAIYPGKTFKTSSNEQVLREVITSQSGFAVALKMLEVLGKDMQEGTFVTEFLMGMPGKQKTLGEVKIKTAESRGMFDVIARELEENSIKPLLQMTYDLYAQFAKWPKREGKYQISVGGISLLLMQQQQTERLAQIFMLALKNETVGQMTDLPDLYKKILGIYNLSDVYTEPVAAGAATGELTPAQGKMVEERAVGDAKRDIGQMSPQNITRITPSAA